jgi:hypothetical protein
MSYAGDLPQPWLLKHPADVHQEGPGLIRVSFDPAITTQDGLITSFVASGGRILEAYASGDSLLEFIKRTTGNHA